MKNNNAFIHKNMLKSYKLSNITLEYLSSSFLQKFALYTKGFLVLKR